MLASFLWAHVVKFNLKVIKVKVVATLNFTYGNFTVFICMIGKYIYNNDREDQILRRNLSISIKLFYNTKNFILLYVNRFYYRKEIRG